MSRGHAIYLCPLPEEPKADTSGCPNNENHTPCPNGYLNWQEWAEEKAKTHRSTRCPECRLFKIWVPKKVRT